MMSALRAFKKNSIKQGKTRKNNLGFILFLGFYFVFYQAACGITSSRLHALTDNRLVLPYLFEADAQHIAEDGFTCKEAVASLLDVVRMRVIVHLVGNLVHAGQRMQNLHVRPAQPQRVVVQHIHVLHPLILHQVREALLLHPRHVHDVGIPNHLSVKQALQQSQQQ